MRHQLASKGIIACALLALLMSRAAAEDIVDKREPVQRTEAERAFVLDQMRLLLNSIMEIEDGLGSGDMDRVAQAAAARGRKANVALVRPQTLAAKETDVWKSMFGSVRGGFDEIAADAAAHAPAEKINAALAGTMRNCVACHQTYRISVEAK